MNCPLRENCPKQKAKARYCPLGDNCYMFPLPRLREQLTNWENYLNSTLNEFSDKALLAEIYQLQSCIRAFLTKLG